MLSKETEQTLEYYNNNSKEFNLDTVSVPFSKWQKEFAKYLPAHAYILDCGCGSGRDSRAFLDMGYKVDAIDGSSKMCEIASKLIQEEVKCMKFQDINMINRYHGIWACASLLHLTYDDLIATMIKLYLALKEDGYLYLSFKYGNFEGMRNARYFLDMTEDKFRVFLDKVNGLIKDKGYGGRFKIVSEHMSSDLRKGRESEKWYNGILKKECF